MNFRWILRERRWPVLRRILRMKEGGRLGLFEITFFDWKFLVFFIVVVSGILIFDQFILGQSLVLSDDLGQSWFSFTLLLSHFLVLDFSSSRTAGKQIDFLTIVESIFLENTRNFLVYETNSFETSLFPYILLYRMLHFLVKIRIYQVRNYSFIEPLVILVFLVIFLYNYRFILIFWNLIFGW